MGTVSRRDFLRGGALFAAGAMGAVSLGGCTAEHNASVNGKVELGETGESKPARPFSTHEADVVVVGSGLAGLYAARRAITEGATVAIVDKGQYGHSGASGINWGHAIASMEFSDDPNAAEAMGANLPFGSDGVTDQAYSVEVLKAVNEVGQICDAIKLGCVTEHEKDGKPACESRVLGGVASDAGFFPRALAQYVKRAGAQVFDYTFALDVVMSPEGHAAGVAAINLETGEPELFRGKAVVLATGSYVSLCGWNGASPYTHSSQDLTGDGAVMFMRAGLAMRDMEELCYDNGQYEPAGTRQCMTGMGVEITDHYRGFNKNKEQFAQIMVDQPETYGQGTYMRLEMKEILEGRGTEHNGIYALTDDLENEERYYRNAKWNMKRVFDYDLPQYVELIPQCWETAGRPFTLNPETSETEIPGLFHAGSASFVWNGMAMGASIGGGVLSGKAAAEIAKNTDRPAVNIDQVNGVFDDAFDLLEREPKDPLRASTVKRSVQTGFWDGMYFLRDEKSIQGVIDELTRIEKEDMPRLSVADKSPQYNTEWREALEARNMITVGIGAAQAALIRKESRGAHCRIDYPKVDNEHYMANTKVQLKDGAWTSEMVPVDDPIIPIETLIESIPQIGLD